MSDMLQYLPEIFTGTRLLVLLVGTIGGLILGATPGLSPTMAVALLVPFTFHMDPATGLVLLGSVFTSTVAGGSLAAILINIPGAPANIATTFDGYPMAKKGRAQEALYISYLSSLIGGVFGIIIMMFFTPPLAKVAMEFGPSEMFWSAMFGVSVMAGLASGSMIKGLFMGFVGMLLSCIGDDPMYGVTRFVFHESLSGGITVIPALIGIFAIPQILGLVETLDVVLEKTHFKPERGVLRKVIGMLPGLSPQLTLGSIIGAIVGIVPGAGGQIAGLIAYDQNKKFCKNPETLGSGDPRGVATVESSNNAMVGPSLIPMLIMGIPGCPTSAVLMGGLLIHGMFPGPDLFLKHADVTYTFFWAMLFAQITMGLFGLLMSRYSYLVTNVSSLMMIGAVMVLAVFGTYTVSNNFDDVVIMFALGLATYFVRKFGFSAAPLVLGIILGPIVETNLTKGIMIGQSNVGLFSYFCTGTVNLIIIALCVLSVGWSLYAEIKHARTQRAKLAAAATCCQG
ncbi:MAG: C4-dicarboxylate ABC transporter permease [Deltaproteobacteria bacterium HGW-Deltaproteobacteria-8]|jgi:putative tricarboxylic transport membrane protein|nr:MAG: C4-dicarboxylate ABC transporter permease [Deltaproteobacteria bacterium HGW-Deltaproteobacteria-8]